MVTIELQLKVPNASIGSLLTQQSASSLLLFTQGQHQQTNLTTYSHSTCTNQTITTTADMVCGKCQRLSKATMLATPGVKKKSEIYFGSSTSSSSSKSGDKTKASATLGNNGIGKVGCLFLSSPQTYANTLNRANYYQNLLGIHMLLILVRVPAPLAQRKLIRVTNTARNVHTKQMVGIPLISIAEPSANCTSLRHLWQI